jgi:DNA-binding NtrC family response regulator
LVASFYAQLHAPDQPAEPPGEVVAGLLRQDWPGNVRELRSAVERRLLLDDPILWRQLAGGDGESDGDGDEARIAEAAPAAGLGGEPDQVAAELGSSFRAAKERAMTRWEKTYLAALLARAGGNQSEAARVARMDRNYLRALLRRHGLGKGA